MTKRKHKGKPINLSVTYKRYLYDLSKEEQCDELMKLLADTDTDLEIKAILVKLIVYAHQTAGSIQKFYMQGYRAAGGK